MKKMTLISAVSALIVFCPVAANAQYKQKKGGEMPKSEAQLLIEKADSSEAPLIVSLDDALKIAMSENVSVKVADKEIERTKYAKKGTYASLFPQIDLSGAYQRTIKKQVMYMDFDMGSMMPGGGSGEGTDTGDGSGEDAGASGAGGGSSNGGGLEVGRWNTWSAGVSASMPIVNAQLWKSIQISGLDVELAVEKARESRLNMVTQVKNAYYASLFAKQAFDVYKEVYENAVKNYDETKKKYDAQKVSDFELSRAKATVANAIPNVYNAESNVILSLWQLKAVMGVDLDLNIDVEGKIDDYASQMFRDVHQFDSLSLDNNSSMKQLEIQIEQLRQSVKAQEFAYIPSLAVAFNFSYNAMTNDFDFKNYKWTPYSYVGLSLNIPIFSGGKRYYSVRQSKTMHTQAKLQKIDVERQLKIGVRQNLTTMETNMKSYYAALDGVAAAEKAYNIAEKSYQVGRSALIEVNDAQLALTQARLGQSQAVYNFLVAKAQLEQTLGYDFTEE